MDPRTDGVQVHARVGYLPGELALYPRLTGERYLRTFASLRDGSGWPFAEQLAERLQLDLDRPIKELSHGNKQKVGLVQAFMHRPDLLVLDEPTQGLDPLMQQTFYAMLDEERERGATVFLSSQGVLPLRDLPILGRLGSDADEGRVRALLGLVRESPSGGCLQIEGSGPKLAAIRRLAAMLAQELRERPLGPERALVLFVAENAGKTLGQYVSDWGKIPVRLVVIDEVAVKDARFAQIGRMKDHVGPVWFYGQDGESRE